MRIRIIALSLLAVCVILAQTVGVGIGVGYGGKAGAWLHAMPVTITNITGGGLTQFQVQIPLNASFEWAKAKADCSDIRVSTNADGSGRIPYWIESCKPGTTTGTVYAKVPSIPNGTSTIYLLYGNPSASSSSNGDSTFEFFDDFAHGPAKGLWAMNDSTTTILADHQAWETSQPHTMSVIDWGSAKDGFRYWAYYGLQDQTTSAVGVARSNDMTTWAKYGGNPILGAAPAHRWPYCVLVGDTVYMAYTKYSGTSVTVVLASSTDGITFTDVKDLVTTDTRNKSQYLWQDPIGGKFYLYYFLQNGATAEIHVKGPSDTPPGLDVATDAVMLTSTGILAAPAIFYYGGVYYFSVEVSAGGWKTPVYAIPTPTSAVTNSMMIADAHFPIGDACFSVQQIGGQVYGFNCRLSGSTWSLVERVQDPAKPRPAVLDTGKWTILNTAEKWYVDHNYSTTTPPSAKSLLGSSNNSVLLGSGYTGTDYIFDVSVETDTVGGIVSSAIRATDVNHYYIVLGYPDATNKLQLYVKNPSLSNITSVTATWSAGTWYTLRMAAHGGVLDVYRDGVLAISGASNSTFASGSPGLGMWNNLLHFTNAKVLKWASVLPTAALGAPIR